MKRSLNDLNLFVQIAIAFAVIVVYTGITYYRFAVSGGHAFMSDDLVHVEYVQDHGPFDAFYKPITTDEIYYIGGIWRPMFMAQTWFMYQIAGESARKSRLIHFGVHMIATLMLFVSLQAISKEFLSSLLLSLVNIGHPFVTNLLYYSTDSVSITVLLLAVVILLLLKFKDHPLWYVSLGAALMVLLFTRENLLAANAAVMAYAVFGAYKKHLTLRQTIITIIVALIPVIIFFMLRSYIMPPRSEGELQDLTFAVQNLRIEEAEGLSGFQAWLLVFYYWFISMLGIVFPIFGQVGVISLDSIATLVIIWVGLLAMFITAGWHRWTTGMRAAVLAIGLVIAGVLLAVMWLNPLGLIAASAPLPPLNDVSISFGFYGLIALCAVYFLSRQWSELSIAHRCLIIFLIAMSFGTASVGLLYYRIRHLRFALLGVLAALALVRAYVPEQRGLRIVRAGSLIYTAILVLVIMIGQPPEF